jgi:hypothetical protein
MHPDLSAEAIAKADAQGPVLRSRGEGGWKKPCRLVRPIGPICRIRPIQHVRGAAASGITPNREEEEDGTADLSAEAQAKADERG